MSRGAETENAWPGPGAGEFDPWHAAAAEEAARRGARPPARWQGPPEEPLPASPPEVPAGTEGVLPAAPSPSRFATREDLTAVLEAVRTMESRVFARLGDRALEAARERRAADAAVAAPTGSPAYVVPGGAPPLGPAPAAGEPDGPWQGYRPVTGAGPGAQLGERGHAGGRDELDAAECPMGARGSWRAAAACPLGRLDGGGRPRERTPEWDLDLPGGRGARKKRWHMAPKCFPHRELGRTKMCDGCDLPLQRYSVSASCPRCTSRYHQECLKFFSEESDLLWLDPRCRKCHEALEDAVLGEVVKTPAVTSLALADGMLGGANYLEPDSIRRNLLELQPAVRLNMIATHLESGTEGGQVTRVFTQAPPPPVMGAMSGTSFANW